MFDHLNVPELNLPCWAVPSAESPMRRPMRRGLQCLECQGPGAHSTTAPLLSRLVPPIPISKSIGIVWQHGGCGRRHGHGAGPLPVLAARLPPACQCHAARGPVGPEWDRADRPERASASGCGLLSIME